MRLFDVEWHFLGIQGPSSFAPPLSQSKDPVDQAVGWQQLAKALDASRLQYPIIRDNNPAVPIQAVGVTGPSQPVLPALNTNSPHNGQVPPVHFTHLGETVQYTANGEPREYVTQPVKVTPQQIFYVLWDYAGRGIRYVVWNYQDLYEQFHAWDGTWWGLVRHMNLLWRGMVCTVLTVGLLEMVPLLELLTQWVMLAGRWIVIGFELMGDAVSEVWRLLEKLWMDVASLLGLV